MRIALSAALLGAAVVTFATTVCAEELITNRRAIHEGRQVSAPGTHWVGFAASRNGRVFFQDGSGEFDVRSNVRSECEHTSGRTCNVIAVPLEWDVVALQCSNLNGSKAFFGGSDKGYARSIAFGRANQNGFDNGDCRVLYSY